MRRLELSLCLTRFLRRLKLTQSSQESTMSQQDTPYSCISWLRMMKTLESTQEPLAMSSGWTKIRASQSLLWWTLTSSWEATMVHFLLTHKAQEFLTQLWRTWMQIMIRQKSKLKILTMLGQMRSGQQTLSMIKQQATIHTRWSRTKESKVPGVVSLASEMSKWSILNLVCQFKSKWAIRSTKIQRPRMPLPLMTLTPWPLHSRMAYLDMHALL